MVSPEPAFVTLGHDPPMRVREPDALIVGVEPDSIAAQLGLQPGDRLRRINGEPPRDIIDYQLWCAQEALELLVEHESGEWEAYEFEKDEHEDLGLAFESDLFTPLRTCNNGCLFCFVLQAPPGMRPTVYVKDDDYRLSFLHGHYTTLTNLTEPHFERIIAQRLSPLYVSVHASEPELRRQLLANPRADTGWHYLERLLAAGIDCHTQVVVCPGVNDGEHLDRTLADLQALGEGVVSVSIVPVGLTRFQAHPLMRPMTRDEARATLAQVDAWRERLARPDNAVVYAADELYLVAEEPWPGVDYYDDFPAIENGVGQTRLFLDAAAEVAQALPERVSRPRRLTIATGEYGGIILRGLTAALDAVNGLQVELRPVANELFGGNVRCAGLLCGGDIAAALGARDPDEIVVVPARGLNEEGLFLDNLSLQDLSERLGCRVVAASTPDELAHLCGCETEATRSYGRRHLPAAAELG